MQGCHLLSDTGEKRGQCLLDRVKVLVVKETCQVAAMCKGMFMQSRVAFPEPRHITSIVSQLTGSIAFLQERESELTLYFQAFSNESGLEESVGFAQLFL